MNYYSGMGIRSSIFRCVLSKHLYTPLLPYPPKGMHIFIGYGGTKMDTNPGVAICCLTTFTAMKSIFFRKEQRSIHSSAHLVEVHFPRALATLAIKSSYSLLPLASLQVLARWRGIHISFRGKFQDSILFIQPISCLLYTSDAADE